MYVFLIQWEKICDLVVGYAVADKFKKLLRTAGSSGIHIVSISRNYSSELASVLKTSVHKIVSRCDENVATYMANNIKPSKINEKFLAYYSDNIMTIVKTFNFPLVGRARKKEI
jgi:hypothetical protein